MIGARQCVGCGCSDLRACPGGCRWTGLNEVTGEGLCSNCAARPLDELMAKLGFSRMSQDEAMLSLFQNAAT